MEIGVRPEGPQAAGLVEKARKPQGAPGIIEEPKYWRGMALSDITPDIVSKFGIVVSEPGIVVINVEPLSPASEAGIRIGDVIYEIERTSVENMNKFQEIVQKVSGDVLVKTYRGYVVIKE